MKPSIRNLGSERKAASSEAGHNVKLVLIGAGNDTEIEPPRGGVGNDNNSCRLIYQRVKDE